MLESECLFHTTVLNRISERVNLSPQSKLFLNSMEKPVHRNKNYSWWIIISHKNIHLWKKISNNFMEKIQPIKPCWLLAFHIYDYTSKVFRNTIHIWIAFAVLASGWNLIPCNSWWFCLEYQPLQWILSAWCSKLSCVSASHM